MDDFKPQNISVYLFSEPELVLDLWQGFSDQPVINLSNDEFERVAYCLPFSVLEDQDDYRKKKLGDEDLCLDLGRALKLGILEVSEHVPFGKHKVPMANIRDTDIPPFHERIRYIAACDWMTFEFQRIGPKLLEFFRHRLVPGRDYSLEFSDQGLELWCEFGDMRTVWGAHIAEPSWDLDGIDFTVVAGTPIPEFTISVLVSEMVCSDCGILRFHLSMQVTSLSLRPVTVNARLDEFAKLWPQEPTYRWERWGPENVFSTSDTALGGAFTTWEMPEPRDPGLSAAVFDPSQGLMEFSHGDSHTYHFIFGRSDLDLDPHHEYILKMRPQGFAAWDYGAKIDLLRAHRSPADWCKNGPILFEPVNAMALVMKGIFERERPMPFFALPLELRDEVYGYVKFAEYADRLRVPKIEDE